MWWPRRWENEFCKGLVIGVIVCLASVRMLAQYPSADTLTPSNKPRAGRPLRIEANVNWNLTVTATELFADYRYYLGGSASGFDIPTGVGFSISSYQFSNASIGLSTGYYRATMRESFTYNPESRPDPIGPAQSVTESMLLTVIPTMITVDYHPTHRQFTGFVGFGLGLSASNMMWEESLSASADPGARYSGVRYNEWHATPLLNIHAGVSLGFDQIVGQRNRPGLFMEVGYQWMPVSAPFFAGTAKTFSTPPASLFRDYTIQAGGIVLRAGIELMVNGG